MRCHASHLCFALSATVVCCNSWAQTSATLAVQVGVPVGDSSSGLVVVASLSVPDTAAGFSGPRAFASVTDSAGQVSFAGLPFGIYSVCAEPQNQLFVEPCRWAPPDTIHLTSQNASGTLRLAVRRGIPIEIRIDDPEGLLSSSSVGRGLQVGAVTPIGRLQLRPVVQDSGGINYRVIAPLSVAASIQVSAGALQVVDGTGSLVNFSGSAAAFNFGPTDTIKSFRFRVRKSQ
jgi:hypothetical protein